MSRRNERKYSLSAIFKFIILFVIISIIIYELADNFDIIRNRSKSLFSLNGLLNDSDKNGFNVTENVATTFDSGSPSEHSFSSIIDSEDSVSTDIIRHTIVRTKLGRLKGFVQNVSGREIQTFLSVPYAQPPIGGLRFQRTKPMNKWTGIRDATRFPTPCIQPEYTQSLFPVHVLNKNLSEDCLYLNIWSPVGGRNKSVMIFIHGGMFTIGSISIDEYDGRMLAAFGDVVLVTIQYRLGIFGFLDLDSDRIPGNMGLFDQYTAIKWVRDNIKYFGGNADSITLFGTSAGSISIGFHMFNNMAQALFKRAILQSGSPMLLKDVFTRGEKIAEQFSIMTGCYEKSENSSFYDDTEPIVDCIKELSFDVITRIQHELVKDDPVPFLPSIPSQYIETVIDDYNETTKLFQKEILTGFNQNEGALILHASYPKMYTRTQIPQHTRIQDVQNDVIKMAKEAGLKEGASSAIANLLIRGDPIDTPERWTRKICDIYSDMMFICPTYQFVDKLISLNTTVYLYMFAQRAKNVVWGEWMDVTHHDESVFVFGYPLRYPQMYNDDDIEISKTIMKTWTTFARTGEMPEIYPESWKKCDSNNKYYMKIKYGQTKLESNYHFESCDLYNLIADYMN